MEARPIRSLTAAVLIGANVFLREIAAHCAAAAVRASVFLVGRFGLIGAVASSVGLGYALGLFVVEKIHLSDTFPGRVPWIPVFTVISVAAVGTGLIARCLRGMNPSSQSSEGGVHGFNTDTHPALQQGAMADITFERAVKQLQERLFDEENRTKSLEEVLDIGARELQRISRTSGDDFTRNPELLELRGLFLRASARGSTDDKETD
jgi:hypothetical protein